MDMERWNISPLNRLGIITSYGMRQFKASLLLLAKNQSDFTILRYTDNSYCRNVISAWLKHAQVLLSVISSDGI